MAEKNSLWKNIRNKAKQNRESGATPKKPTTEMIRQERKINAEKYDKGGKKKSIPRLLPVNEQGLPYVDLNPVEISAPVESFEEKTNRYLGNPMGRAEKEAFLLGEGEDALDNVRHPLAGLYTANAIKDKLDPYIPSVIATGAGFLGSTAAGIGHEMGTMFSGDDTRPWSTKLREAGEDIFNNTVGAGLSTVPFMSDQQKKDAIINASYNNMLPDGYGDGNMYLKKDSKAEGGFYPTQGPPKALFKGYAEGGYMYPDGGKTGKLKAKPKETPIYVDLDTPAGRKRYNAYKDSSDLYSYDKLHQELEPTLSTFQLGQVMYGFNKNGSYANNQRRLLQETEKILKSNPRIKYGSPGSLLDGGYDDYHLGDGIGNSPDLMMKDNSIVPDGIWLGGASNDDWSNVKPKQKVIPYFSSKSKKPPTANSNKPKPTTTTNKNNSNIVTTLKNKNLNTPNNNTKLNKSNKSNISIPVNSNTQNTLTTSTQINRAPIQLENLESKKITNIPIEEPQLNLKTPAKRKAWINRGANSSFDADGNPLVSEVNFGDNTGWHKVPYNTLDQYEEIKATGGYVKQYATGSTVTEEGEDGTPKPRYLSPEQLGGYQKMEPSSTRVAPVVPRLQEAQYRAQAAKDVKNPKVTDDDFKDKHGYNKHVYQMNNDPKYRAEVEANAKITARENGAIDLPSTYMDSKSYVGNPNAAFMNPNNLTGEAAKANEEFHGNIINALLPIPGLQPVGSIPSIGRAIGRESGLLSRLTKAADPAEDFTRFVEVTPFDYQTTTAPGAYMYDETGKLIFPQVDELPPNIAEGYVSGSYQPDYLNTYQEAAKNGVFDNSNLFKTYNDSKLNVSNVKKYLKNKIAKTEYFLNTNPIIKQKPNTTTYNKKLKTDKEYESWKKAVLGEYHNDLISLNDFKKAHKKSIDFFNKELGTSIATGKEHGLYIKSLFADKSPNFNSLQFDDAGQRLIVNKPDLNSSIYDISNAPQHMEDFIKTQGYNISNLTPEERMLMESYAHGYDNSMNGVLRGKGTGPINSFYANQAEKLNQGILKNKFAEPHLVRRGIQSDYPVELLDPITHKPTGVTKFRSELGVDDVFMDNSFLSTSMKPGGWGRSELSELIQIPGGSKQSFAVPEAATLTEFRGENEAILPKGLIRQVIGDNIQMHPELRDWNARFATRILNPHATGGYTMKNNNQSWKQYLQYAQGGYTNPYNQYQDDPYLQYAYGGYEYGNGGRTLKNIGAGAFGVLEGLVDTTFGWIPGVDQATDAAYRGLQKLGGSSEDEIREQDSIHGYGQTAGAVGSAILTSGATTGSAISEGAEGLGQGISRGSETSEVAQGIGKGLNIAGAVVGTAYNASNASKASTEAFKLSNAGSQGIGKFAAAAPKSAAALNAARTTRAANSLDSAGNVIGNAAPEGTKIVTDAAGNASSIKPSIGVFAAPTPSAPNVSSLAPNLPAAATASAAIPKSLPTSVPSTSDYSRLEKVGDIVSGLSSLPKSQEPPEMAPPVPVPPAPKPQPQVNYDQFAVNAPTINTGFETPNYDFGYETPSNNYYAAQGGNITNNSLNLRNTMRYKRFAKGGTFDQYGINMIPDSAGLHHESAYGGVPIGPDALAEGGEIKMKTGDGGQYIVSDKVDGAETQKDFMFSKGGKYKELNRTLADGMKQDLDRYTFGSLATSDRVKGDLRRPFDSYSQSTIEQIKNKWQQKTEYARQRSQQEQAIAQAEEQKRMAEEQYIAAYGGKINPKKYPGLNMTKKARGGYVYNPMTQPMLATGGPVYGDPASPYTYAMGGMYGDPYARGGQIDYTNDMYAGGGPLVGNVPQPFNGPAAQNRGGMLMNYADGGMVSPEQQMMQEQQMQQQGGGEEQMMQMVQQVAQAIMGGANPEQIMQQLVQSGIPPEQAQQVIQAAMQMASQQQPMQQEQQMMPQQGMADGGMMQQQPGAATKIAEALQQGAQPQDILKQLIDSGMPQEQAMAMVQAVMGQLKNQMQQQPQQQMMAPQQPMMAARGGYFNGRKQYAESGEILPTIIPATDEHPSYFEGVAYDNPSDTSSPSYPVSINPTQYDKYTGKSTTAPTGWRPQSDIINSAQSQNNKMFPESWQTIAAGTAQALPGLASAAYSFGKLKDRKLTPNLTPSTTVDYSSERVDLREEGRRGIATALDTMKRNAPTSGSYMSNAREAVLRGNKVIGNQISKSWQNQKNEQAKYDFESGKINADTRNKINEINEGMYQNAIEQGFRSSQDAINKVANYYTGKEGRDIQRWQAQNTNTTNHLWYTPVAGQPPVQVFKNKDGEFWYGDKRIG